MSDKPEQEPYESWPRTLAGLETVDRQIDHHTSELDRLWALRGSMAARLDALGATVPPEPRRRQQSAYNPAAAEEVDVWLDDRFPPTITPPAQQRVGDRLLQRMAAAGIDPARDRVRPAPGGVEIQDPEPRRGSDGSPVTSIANVPPQPVVELMELDSLVRPSPSRNPGYYHRVLVRADDIPLASHIVWVLLATEEGRRPMTHEAHLATLDKAFQGVALCGFEEKDPNRWWSPTREDMQAQVELCGDCARYIPGARRQT